MRLVHHRDGRRGLTSPWPDWLPEPVTAALAASGITAPWRHQVEVAEAARAGRHVAVATPTASGKTLAYLLPVLTATYGGPAPVAPERTVSPDGNPALTQWLQRPHTALYLAPTKALAHDQLRVCEDLRGPGGVRLPSWRVSTLDGDSDRAERDWARDHAAYVLTNPDMLHRSVLPNHQRWGHLLRSLRYVIIDEAHRYRGVFGAHVSQVIRRLRRLCRHYGADPVFLLASATAANAGEYAGTLIGASTEQVHLVDADASPRAGLDLVLWDCQGEDAAQPGSALNDSSGLLARLVDDGKQVLTFVRSRRGAEVVAADARTFQHGGESDGGDRPDSLTDGDSGVSPAAFAVPGRRAIEAYRAGYLPMERRELERRLQTGELAGVAATNALELGVDISGMDAVVICGYPGTMSALWQQAGRAGRGGFAGPDALVVLVSGADPLDRWLFEHPDAITSGVVEPVILHPENPFVLAAHLAAAAQELPATEADTEWFGEWTVPLLDRLAARGTLRRRPTGWFWTRPERAVDEIDLRAMGGSAVEIIDVATGRVVGTVDPGSVDGTVHPGAVYVHAGDSWLVLDEQPDQPSDEADEADDESEEPVAPEELGALLAQQEASDRASDHAVGDSSVPDPRAEGVVMVRRARPGYTTQPLSTSQVSIRSEAERKPSGAGTIGFGDVTLTSQVTGFLRRDEFTGQVWDQTPLDLPERILHTQAVWWTLPDEALPGDFLMPQLAGGAHGAEHTAIGLLSLFAPCDRSDIGGLSTVSHPDTGAWTVFVHDGHPGGAGFARAAYRASDDWLRATRDRLVGCACAAGCPACVMSPKCGNANQMLDKQSAITLVELLLP